MVVLGLYQQMGLLFRSSRKQAWELERLSLLSLD
jgi:hypothetical protein